MKGCEEDTKSRSVHYESAASYNYKQNAQTILQQAAKMREYKYK